MLSPPAALNTPVQQAVPSFQEVFPTKVQAGYRAQPTRPACVVPAGGSPAAAFAHVPQHCDVGTVLIAGQVMALKRNAVCMQFMVTCKDRTGEMNPETQRVVCCCAQCEEKQPDFARRLPMTFSAWEKHCGSKNKSWNTVGSRGRT